MDSEEKRNDKLKIKVGEGKPETYTTVVFSSSTIASAAGGAVLGSALYGLLGSVIGAFSGATISVVASARDLYSRSSEQSEDANG